MFFHERKKAMSTVYNEDLAAIETLAVAMASGNATTGIKAVQDAEQQRAREAHRLPVDMRPDREAFEALGFVFSDLGDGVLCQATLPEGWTLKETSNGYWTDLVDEKGRKRGSSFYKGAFYDRSGNMSLKRRFSIDYDHADDRDDGPIVMFVKDFDGSVVHEVGKCDSAYSDEHNQLSMLAEEYLKVHYPDWKDPTKYW
jgi:hypothetical protein